MFKVSSLYMTPANLAELTTVGFLRITLLVNVRDAADRVFDAADRFFAEPTSLKLQYRLQEALEGFRYIGEEYSESQERPDLAESFSLWLRNRDRRDVREVLGELQLYRRMLEVGAPCYRIAEEFLRDIAEQFGAAPSNLEIARMSYLQVNSYRPTLHDREFLQDRHEDGHLFTIVKSTAPGLEIELGGRFVEADISPDEALLMPGSLLSAMTGGAIQPLYHRVRRMSDPVRYSLMFFVNPSIESSIAPWVLNSSNEGIDIRELAVQRSAAFGLRSLSEARF